MLTSKIAITGIVVAGLAVGCQETATSPRHGGTTPRFATASDTGGGGGGGRQSHVVANGDIGFANWSGGDTLSGTFNFGSLTVGRSGTTNNPQTFLNYFIEQCDIFFNCSFVYGFGLIPNRDLSGGMSGRQLHLSTNTAGNPNFFSVGPTGQITVDWKVNGFFTATANGTSQLVYPGVRQLFQGSSSTVSATAVGKVVGVSISPFSDALIGTSHNVTIDIFH